MGMLVAATPAAAPTSSCCCRGWPTRENTEAVHTVQTYYVLVGLEGWPVSGRCCLPGVDP